MIPTASISNPAIVHDVARYDRAFYSGIAILLAAMALVGFGPTFYFRWLFGAPSTISGTTVLSPLTLLHGTLFSAWMVLFIVQTSLIAARRVTLHRRLGVGGAVLAGAMVIVGLSTAVAAARRGNAPPGIDPLTFLAIPTMDLVLFAGFVTAAVLRRREKDAHKRLMLLAYISIIAAAAARMPGVFPYGPLAFFAIGYGTSLLGAAYDYWSRGRVSRVYMWGIAVLALSVPLRLALSSTSAWRSFAEFITR